MFCLREVDMNFPDISPVIFSIGPVDIRWYSMAYLVGILAAWVLATINIKKYKSPMNNKDLEDLAFYATLGVILGGRLGYVLFYGGDTFIKNPLSVFALWQGGMSFHGGIIGVITAIYLFARKMKLPFLKVSDLVVLYVPIGIFLGRLANFVNDELWGRVTDVAWAVKFPSGGYLPRHPSQIYEALTEGLLMFVVLNWLWHYKWVRDRVGFVSAMFAIIYGMSRILMEQFREPDAHMGFFFSYFTMGQLLSIPLVLAGLYVIFTRKAAKQ
ncbi:MAG: prolipoprotein diacylglyceryl transferase [Lactobacillus sp.]|jgi:phosphatidylglycerol:prolipoprotein diacylglycerol transferase|nr:prolipoprotein diacylglyceryl transferase [Lactobacillus sp.]